MPARWPILSRCNNFISFHHKLINCRNRQKWRLLSAVHLTHRDPADDDQLKDDVRSKIIYNEILLNAENLARNKELIQKRELMKECRETGFLPQNRSRFLNYLTDETSDDTKKKDDKNDNSPVNYPYQTTKKVKVDYVNKNELNGTELDSKYRSSRDFRVTKFLKKNIKYEDPRKFLNYDESDEIESIPDPESFGTCDPDIPCSNVPCSGCGALLHCMNMSIPGFMPKETFVNLKDDELKALRCQRCLFLEECNVALDINVSPNDYVKIISQIKEEIVNILLMVDLTDFPCSISEDIIKIIGKKKPVFVVGNKVDLLIDDGENSLKHKKKCLIKSLYSMGCNMANIKHVGLISAKTGYGVENLITALHTYRHDNADFYILGCTNSGKSTLFNRLIQSDMCKVKADLLQRATISQWPGTTLNLLKFPVSRRQDWHSFLRMERLKVTNEQEAAMAKVRKQIMGNRTQCQVALMGFIGKTLNLRDMSPNGEPKQEEKSNLKWTKWFYDTPGFVDDAQILTLLTTYELTKILPAKIIVPRTFKLLTGQTLFIGGLARIDFLSGPVSAWFTVFASECIPLTVALTRYADMLYKKLLGTKWFGVPYGNEERIKNWPSLRSKVLEVSGMTKYGKGSDVVLSSAGWVTVQPNIFSACRICIWTPEGRGIYLRQPTLIRESCSYRGRKIGNTPAYSTKMKIVENINVTVEK